jgi:carbonic anhydrase
MRRLLILAISLALTLPLFAQQKPVDVVDPEAMWKALMTGNLKFEGGEITYLDLKNERKRLEKSQMPPITILACSDSRVPPEIVFNQSLGALFIVRTAGNVADDFGLASIEYAIKNNWTSLIVVLGHEGCGAVEAALYKDDPVTPSLLSLVQRIRGSFYGIPYITEPLPDEQLEPLMLKATEANARMSVAWLTANSSVVRNAVLSKRLKIVPAYYSLKTGAVRAIE